MDRSAHRIEQLKKTAISAARAAGQIQLMHFREKPFITKKKEHDLTTSIDLDCEQAIVKLIQNNFPEHAIISEESGWINPDGNYTWIVDPLDGSVNYYHGIPFFNVSIACYYRVCPNLNKNGFLSMMNNPIIGVVFAPFLNELYVAIPGLGATCNDRPIFVGAEKNLEESIISLSFGSRENIMLQMEHITSVIMRQARKIRVFGSTGIDLVNIASGRLSGLIQGCIRIWDFAAARIIVEESGGQFEAFEFAPNQWQILACAPGIYEELKKIL